MIDYDLKLILSTDGTYKMRQALGGVEVPLDSINSGQYQVEVQIANPREGIVAEIYLRDPRRLRQTDIGSSDRLINEANIPLLLQPVEKTLQPNPLLSDILEQDGDPMDTIMKTFSPQGKVGPIFQIIKIDSIVKAGNIVASLKNLPRIPNRNPLFFF